MSDKITTTTSTSFKKTSSLIDEASNTELIKTLDKSIKTNEKQAKTNEINTKTLNKLIEKLEQRESLTKLNNNSTSSANSYLEQIRIEQASLGLARARLRHAELVENYEKNIKEANKNAYKENTIYKAYSAVHNEKNSKFTAGLTNIGLSAATGGMINPVIANALHLDKFITAPITALTHKLLGIGHTKATAIKDRDEIEKQEKIKEIAEGVKKINKSIDETKGTTEKEEGSGLSGFLGKLLGIAGFFLAGKFLARNINMPEWLKKALPGAMAGFAGFGLPGAIIGGLLGFFYDDLMDIENSIMPKLKEALGTIGDKIKDYIGEAVKKYIIYPLTHWGAETAAPAVKDTTLLMGGLNYLSNAAKAAFTSEPLLPGLEGGKGITEGAKLGNKLANTKVISKLRDFGQTIKNSKVTQTILNAGKSVLKPALGIAKHIPGAGLVSTAGKTLNTMGKYAGPLTYLTTGLEGYLRIQDAANEKGIGFMDAATEGGDILIDATKKSMVNNAEKLFSADSSLLERGVGALGLVGDTASGTMALGGKVGQEIAKGAFSIWDNTFGKWFGESPADRVARVQNEYREKLKNEHNKALQNGVIQNTQNIKPQGLTDQDKGYIQAETESLNEDRRSYDNDINSLPNKQFQAIQEMKDGIISMNTIFNKFYEDNHNYLKAIENEMQKNAGRGYGSSNGFIGPYCVVPA